MNGYFCDQFSWASFSSGILGAIAEMQRAVMGPDGYVLCLIHIYLSPFRLMMKYTRKRLVGVMMTSRWMLCGCRNSDIGWCTSFVLSVGA